MIGTVFEAQVLNLSVAAQQPYCLSNNEYVYIVTSPGKTGRYIFTFNLHLKHNHVIGLPMRLNPHLRL